MPNAPFNWNTLIPQVLPVPPSQVVPQLPPIVVSPDLVGPKKMPLVDQAIAYVKAHPALIAGGLGALYLLRRK